MKTTFADRMTLAVKESGLALQAIADLAGTSKGQVSQWQTEGAVNSENVKADVLEKNCVALKIRPRWLLYGEPPMRPTMQSQSQPARLNGQMILLAFREAQKAMSFTGQDAEGFSPGVDLGDADILARAILHMMDDSGKHEHAQPEAGNDTARGSHRQDGGADRAPGAKEAGGESKPAAGKRKERAA